MQIYANKEPQDGGLVEPRSGEIPIVQQPPSKIADILGTLFLSVLSGHWRYAHIAALRADAVSAAVLGMDTVVSEDTVRRVEVLLPQRRLDGKRSQGDIDHQRREIVDIQREQRARAALAMLIVLRADFQIPPCTPYQSCLAASDWLKRPPVRSSGTRASTPSMNEVLPASASVMSISIGVQPSPRTATATSSTRITDSWNTPSMTRWMLLSAQSAGIWTPRR